MKVNMRLLNTVYGRNLVAELKNIVQKPYLVVTMEDLWDVFKDKFDDDAIVHFVKTLEYDEIMKEIDTLGNFASIIGLGGGQAVDYAKMVAWKTNLPLYQMPTSLATNAVFGVRSGIRFNSMCRYIGYVEPKVIYVDYDVIRSGPRSLNCSGVCDVFCFHNAIFDWKRSYELGKCEEKWPYDEEMAQQAEEVYRNLAAEVDEVANMTDRGIYLLAEALRWGGAAFPSNGWNPRQIEGVDHVLFYTLEYMTKKKFIHGQPVCLGIYTGSVMQDNEPDWILNLIHKAGVEIRPESMGVTWDDVFAALKYQKEYVVKPQAGLWHTIANDFDVDDAFCEKIKKNVLAVYGEWKG